jgi:hypothetical protein
MSLEQSVAALTARGAELLALPQALANQFTAGRAALEQIYTSRLAAKSTVIYLNAIDGIDTNTGSTTAQAVATLHAAVARIPTGGVGEIILKSDVTLTEQINVYGRSIVLRSDSNVRRRVVFGRSYEPDILALGRQSIGFRLGGAASLALVGLTVVVPPLDGIFVNVTPNTNAPLITTADVSLGGPQQVTIAYCDIEQPPTPFAALLGSLSLWNLYWFINTLTGPVQAIEGRLLQGFTSTSGTAPPAVLRTNLNLI